MSLRIAFAALVAVIAFAACGGGDDGGSAAPEAQGAGGSEAVAVAAVDNEFDPADITVPAGGSIDLNNDGEAPHNFSVRGEDVDVDVEPGDSASVNLSALDAGNYEVFCKLHESAGMTGTLKIEG
jgi:plastocyanin